VANRQQHTIPQFYLRRFLNPGWVYRRGETSPRCIRTPSSVAVHRDYYGKSKTSKTTLDELNTAIENRSAPSLDRLINSPKTFTPTDRVSLSFLLANMFVRNPVRIKEWSNAIVAAVNKIDETARQTHGRQHEALVLIGDPSKFNPKSYDEAPIVIHEELKKHAQLLVAKGGHRIAAGDNFGTLEEIAKCIEKMAFLIFEAPKGLFFVTSDRPLTLQRRKTGSQSGAGWANDDALASIALSPTRFLLMFYTNRFDMVQTAAIPEQVAGLNVEVIRFADKEIYSPSKYCEANDWMQSIGWWCTKP
jgi:hypothetical protein